MLHAVFLDTSFIIALENRDDVAHQKALTLERQLAAWNTVYITHWGVLLEIGDGYARLGRRAKGKHLLEQLQRQPYYDVQQIEPNILVDAVALFSQHDDKEWGLTDCVSFIIMKRNKISAALTADVHFEQAGFEALLR